MWAYLFVTALTFYLLVPGVLVTLPPNSSRQTVLITHSVLFALVHLATHKLLFSMPR